MTHNFCMTPLLCIVRWLSTKDRTEKGLRGGNSIHPNNGFLGSSILHTNTIYLSIHIFLYLSIYIYISIYPSIHLSIYLTMESWVFYIAYQYLSIYLSLSIYLPLFIYLSIYLLMDSLGLLYCIPILRSIHVSFRYLSILPIYLDI